MTKQGKQTARRSDHVAEAPSTWGRSVFGEVRKFTMSDADVRVLLRCEVDEVDG